MTEKVIVTGSAGFIGSHIAADLADRIGPENVIGIDNLAGGFAENEPAGITSIRLDLAEPEATEALADLIDQADPRAIIHAAAWASEAYSSSRRRHTIRNVWTATANLITAAEAVGWKGRFVFLSSAAVYGRGAGNIHRPNREIDPPRPIDPYGAAKLAAEHDLAASRLRNDLIILRPHNVYGPKQNIWDPTRNVFGIWTAATMTGRPLIIYSRGRATWRQFTYIDDITPLIVAAAFTQHLAHQIYNIGEQYAYQLTEAAHCFASAAGLEAFRADYQAARPEAAAVICEHARQIELQYAAGIPADRPETTLAAGLAKFWTAARQAWEQWPNRRNFKPPPAELPTPADKLHT